MMICTEKEEPEEESKPVKKKDGVPKVDKKYLMPHGITPPLKNVRKRRFRRTLKKKVSTFLLACSHKSAEKSYWLYLDE
jgi:TATA-binding protein-associated factor Taf7